MMKKISLDSLDIEFDRLYADNINADNTNLEEFKNFLICAINNAEKFPEDAIINLADALTILGDLKKNQIELKCAKCGNQLKNCAFMSCKICPKMHHYCFNCNMHQGSAFTVLEDLKDD